MVRVLEQIKRKDAQRLCDAFLSCRDTETMYAFMRDLMTESEMQEFANRLTAATMLSAKQSYGEIAAATGMSTTTIARVSTWLKKGSGYASVLKVQNKNAHHISKKIAKSGLS